MRADTRHRLSDTVLGVIATLVTLLVIVGIETGSIQHLFSAGGNRTLNKFRLSATTASGLVRAPAVKPVPKDVAEALKIPAAQRTAAQRTRVRASRGPSESR